MREWLAALPGVLAALAVLALAAPVSLPPVPNALRRVLRRAGASEVALAAEVGLTTAQLALLQVTPGLAAALAAELVGGLPVLALAAGVAAAGAGRLALRVRSGARAKRRQDAVLDAVRMLRGLLEAGGTGVQDALAVLARRGPEPLRDEFALIVAASRRGSHARAWAEARQRVADPVFDLLSVALLVQRPSGGSLAPLLADLEESVAAIYEVAREAEALQVQARSAAGLVVLLPIAFLLVLSAFRSPYLDAYHTPNGTAFLTVMLALVGGAYLWILRWLRLPGEPRLELG
jgi:tight adherence protein B